MYRSDGPLFFGNVEYYVERVRSAIEVNPGEETSVLLDMEGIGSVDTTAVDHLADLVDELHQRGMAVGLTRANQQVLGLLTRAGIIDRLGPDRVFPTINAAVEDHRRRAGS